MSASPEATRRWWPNGRGWARPTTPAASSAIRFFATAATNCRDTNPGGKTVASLDPSFICSDMLSPAATSARIKILQNDIYYGIGVVAIDRHKNPSIPSLVFGKPIASLDFYNEYRTDNPSMP